MEERAQLARDEFRNASRRSLFRHEQINILQWTEEYRRHTKYTKSPGSKVRVSEMEVTRGPYLWTNEPGVREAGLMACTQSGKTTVMESIAGYFAERDPCPILYVGPTIPDAVQFVEEKMMEVFRATPVLKPLIKEGRNSGNRNTYKMFPGGRIRAIGTEARGGFTMVADRVILMDEIDGHGNAGGDGDTMQLALGRTPEFSHNYLLFAVSSPTVKDRGKGLPTIWKFFQKGDMRLPYVQCQGCGHDHFMEFETSPGNYSLHIPKRDNDERGQFEPERASYICPKCGYAHSDLERVKMIRPGAIHWRATKPFKCCGEWQEPAREWDECDQTREDYERIWQPFGDPLGVEPIGFGDRGVCRAKCKHCGKMPVKNRTAVGRYGRYYRKQFSLEEMASQFVDVIRDPAKRQAFWNTILGLPFEEKRAVELSADHLESLGEVWEERPKKNPDDPFEPTRYFVPWPVCQLTIGIDVQAGADDGSGSRFALETVGWGVGEESWSLDYQEIHCNTRDFAEWDRVLLPYIQEMHQRSDGRPFRASSVCIDAGNNPDQAAAFVGRHGQRFAAMGIHLFAVKGVGENSGQTYATWANELTITKAKAFNTYGAKLWGVGVRQAKDTIAAHLATEEGPGTMHFPAGRGPFWHRGLLAEDNVIEGGRSVWRHLRKEVRNEPLDCRVYALAGLRAMQKLFPNHTLDWWAKKVGAVNDIAKASDFAAEGEASSQSPEGSGETAKSVPAAPAVPKPVKAPVPTPAPSKNAGQGAPSRTGWTPPKNYWD